MTLRERLIQFIEQDLLQGAGNAPIGPQDSLIKSGVLDSMAVLGLIGLIEEETGLRVPDEEVQLEQFETITSIEALVVRLRARARG
jgi:acyl carrier protein